MASALLQLLGKMVAKLIKVFAHACIGLSGEAIVKEIMTV